MVLFVVLGDFSVTIEVSSWLMRLVMTFETEIIPVVFMTHCWHSMELVKIPKLKLFIFCIPQKLFFNTRIACGRCVNRDARDAYRKFTSPLILVVFYVNKVFFFAILFKLSFSTCSTVVHCALQNTNKWKNKLSWLSNLRVGKLFSKGEFIQFFNFNSTFGSITIHFDKRHFFYTCYFLFKLLPTKRFYFLSLLFVQLFSLNTRATTSAVFTSRCSRWNWTLSGKYIKFQWMCLSHRGVV